MTGVVEYVENFDFNALSRDTRLPPGLTPDESITLAKIHATGLEEIVTEIASVVPSGPVSRWVVSRWVEKILSGID